MPSRPDPSVGPGPIGTRVPTPPPCLILGPPRSFSSVLCAALGRHPRLHGFPELNLFTCDTVGELLALDEAEAARSGVALTYCAGLIRAVAHLDDAIAALPESEGFAVARRWIERRAAWSTRRMFDHLLERIAPRRGLDKSPRTALSRHHVQRAMAWCPAAHVIHLVRHPVPFATSLVRRAAPSSPVDPDRYAFALHLWLHTHRSLREATARLTATRRLVLRGEAVLADPASTLASVARWLDAPTGYAEVEAMLHPERSPYANLALVPPGGDNDLGFLTDPRLRAGDPVPPLAIPASWRVDRGLADEVIDLACALGYDGSA